MQQQQQQQQQQTAHTHGDAVTEAMDQNCIHGFHKDWQLTPPRLIDDQESSVFATYSQKAPSPFTSPDLPTDAAALCFVPSVAAPPFAASQSHLSPRHSFAAWQTDSSAPRVSTPTRPSLSASSLKHSAPRVSDSSSSMNHSHGDPSWETNVSKPAPSRVSDNSSSSMTLLCRAAWEIHASKPAPITRVSNRSITARPKALPKALEKRPAKLHPVSLATSHSTTVSASSTATGYSNTSSTQPSKLTAARKKRPQVPNRWTSETDAKLLRAVQESCGGKPPIRWKKIANRYFSGERTAQQLRSRWNRGALNPKIKKSGKWSEEEDAKLCTLREGGSDFCDIAKQLGRSTELVRVRYQSVLDPTLNKSPWDEAEVEQLLLAVEEVGHKWKLISQMMKGGRSQFMCQNKWLWVQKQKKNQQARYEAWTATSSPMNDDRDEEDSSGELLLAEPSS